MVDLVCFIREIVLAAVVDNTFIQDKEVPHPRIIFGQEGYPVGGIVDREAQGQIVPVLNHPLTVEEVIMIDQSAEDEDVFFIVPIESRNGRLFNRIGEGE